MQFIEKEEFPTPIALETAKGGALTAASMYQLHSNSVPKALHLELYLPWCNHLWAEDFQQSAYQARQISRKRPIGHKDQNFFMALDIL